MNFALRPLVLGLVALLLLVSSAQGRILKIATVVPDGSSWLVEMRKAADEIKRQTNGRVKVRFYPGGVMGSDKTVLRKVRVGQLQGGAFPSGALASVYPDIELYSLPLIFRSYDEVDYVRAKMDEQLREGLREKGFVVLALSDNGFAHLMSQKPLRRVEDLGGTKAWIPEDDIMSETAFEVAGVAPVPLPIADVYTALQTGLIDTVAAPPIGAIAFQWHTKLRYLTDVPLMYLIGVLALDRKVFDKLSEDDQKVVIREIGDANERLDRDSRAGDANARAALQAQDIEFVKASSPDEVARWRRISEEAVAKLRTLDRYSEKAVQELLGLLKTYRSEQAAAQ